MDELAQFVQKSDPKHARKRPRDPSSWKREVERKKRFTFGVRFKHLRNDHLLENPSKLIVSKTAFFRRVFQILVYMARTSADTILTFKRNDDLDNYSDWSIVWSTDHIAGMDMATGAGSTRRRKTGRRRLRLAALTFGCLFTMHTRISAAALTGGYFMFMLLLIPSVVVLANPLRHFEVYLGQWSLSGPGRAFRIIPMFDGIGIAICMHAILRAVISVVLAAVLMLYVMHSTSDKRLPYTYCRTMDLKTYEPEIRFIIATQTLQDSQNQQRSSLETQNYSKSQFNEKYPINLMPYVPKIRYIVATQTLQDSQNRQRRSPGTQNDSDEVIQNYPMLADLNMNVTRKSEFCAETFPNNYPPIFKSPAYNFFYVELIHYRPDHDLSKLNMTLLIAIASGWGILWFFMIVEKFSHGRIIWNNMYPWMLCIPWVWSGLLIFAGTKRFFAREKPLRNIFHIGGHKEVLDFVTDVFVAATYIHAAALGSELIHGKGLNHFASGHIDPALNGENIWHSGILLISSALSAGGASLCGLTDYMQMKGVNQVQESTLWVFPLISKCSLGGNYGHLISTLLFIGLILSYLIVAFVCLKTALHTIFEYQVKLVFVEQLMVGLLIIACMGLSVIFTTNASLGLLESIDVFLAGIATPLICALEVLGLLYMYRSHDFISDIHVATEENACSSRISILWQVIPFLEIVLLALESWMIAKSELPGMLLWVGLGCVAIIVLALPLRALHNAYAFLQPPKPR